MDYGLKEKIVFVTGGSRGIGLACAELFLAEGAKVGICSRSAENVDKARASLPGLFGTIADLVDPQQALGAVDAVERALGPIDILVNSAGAAKRTVPDELTPAAWRAAMDAKFFSYINVIDPVIKRMAARSSGVIIVISGHGGKVPTPTHLAGGAANAALMLTTTGLGHAYAGRGVRVIGISPGLTETDRVAQVIRAEAKLAGISEEAARKDVAQRIPIGRLASPQDIANAVVFAASVQANYLTAVNITMTGGENPVIF
jgi:NAD(P)-dependent dehydrogenase (short-subunit alcohol dehydrogenase family)